MSFGQRIVQNVAYKNTRSVKGLKRKQIDVFSREGNPINDVAKCMPAIIIKWRMDQTFVLSYLTPVVYASAWMAR